MYDCARCHRLVVICSRCDRGAALLLGPLRPAVRLLRSPGVLSVPNVVACGPPLVGDEARVS